MNDKEIAAYKRKLYYDTDPVRHKAYGLAWKKANADKVKAYQIQYYQRTKEAHKLRALEWQKANPKRWKELQIASYQRRKTKKALTV
jgi:hypothetical protein